MASSAAEAGLGGGRGTVRRRTLQVFASHIVEHALLPLTRCGGLWADASAADLSSPGLFFSGSLGDGRSIRILSTA